MKYNSSVAPVATGGEPLAPVAWRKRKGPPGAAGLARRRSGSSAHQMIRGCGSPARLAADAGPSDLQIRNIGLGRRKDGRRKACIFQRLQTKRGFEPAILQAKVMASAPRVAAIEAAREAGLKKCKRKNRRRQRPVGLCNLAPSKGAGQTKAPRPRLCPSDP